LALAKELASKRKYRNGCEYGGNFDLIEFHVFKEYHLLKESLEMVVTASVARKLEVS
jgi:hypothetical protein